ncbi:MAG TPA: [protein-PII] uridylyltransferase, partial [Halieaceae bacterium]|nr:[protein-PII] uridylyltransferase [Halieaceae bacterium]
MFDRAAFASAIASGDTLLAGKQALKTAADYLDSQFNAGTRVAELLHLRSWFMDVLLGTLWDSRDWSGVEPALVAVGGYGRGELHPHSDIDILVLLGEDSEPCHAQLEGFVTQLWDLGLNIGHSVRTVSECCNKARKDITILTNLMETRVIRGPQALMDAVRARTGPDQMWPSADFFRAKLEEQRARHAKFADTEYNLEPNVKSSPGGLRDLQIIAWIA